MIFEPLLLVEKGFEDDNFIALLNETRESTEHSLVRASGDSHLRIWIYIPTEKRRVSFCNCLPEPWSSL